MATYTSGSLDSVKITAGDGDAYKTRYLTFSWSVISTSTGKTTINWEVYGKGGNTAYSTFSIKLNGETVYSINNKAVSYKSSTSLASGTKTYEHNSSGAATVNVEITVTKIWKTISSNTKTSKSWDLETNYPYTACYWSNDSRVWIDDSIQKPGADITVNWSGAQPGIANPIAGFEVYYSIDEGGSWIEVSKTISKDSSSTILTVPSNRERIISAKVVIKNTEPFTNPSKSGGSCRINKLPSAPTNLTPSQTIIPSTATSVSFSMNVGTDEDGQSSYTIKYATSEDSTKRDYIIGDGLSFNTTKDELTYYFWTWDGLETSEDSSSCTIIKNTKPTVSIDLMGTYIYDITAIKGDNGQSNNQYSYGYTYGEDKLITTTASTTYNAGDIRYLLSQPNGLEQGKTYKFRYWVKRNDGIEDSDPVYSDWISFETPKLTLNTGNGPEGYFGTNIDINIDKNNNNYYPTGTVSFDRIGRGKQLNSIEFKNNEDSSQSFNIKLASPLTRVEEFDFTNLQIPTTFTPYSESTLSINMASRGKGYGFGENSEPKLIIDDQDKGAIFSKSSSDNTWNFKFTPDHLWGDNGIISKIVTDGTVKKTLKLKISNDFGEEFSKDVSLNFDFRKIPTITNFQVCDGAGAIKEGTEVSIQGEIWYFSKSVNFRIYEPQSNETFYDLQDTQEDYNKEPWVKIEETGGWKSNPYVCVLEGYTDPEKQIPAQEKTYDTKFQIIAQSGNVSGQGESQKVTIQRHVPARIRFTELEYSDNTLSGRFKIEDFGYDNDTNGRVDSVYLDSTKIYSGNITTNNEIPFEISKYAFGDANFKSLAPTCKTTFSLDGAETTKETINLEYLIVYNILPTIAYRQNYLGVNTKDPYQNGEKGLENPVITISAYNQQKTVYLVSGSNTASIDLTTGKQVGFIIDCGEWEI